MKMFSTQLHGLFQKIIGQEEQLEDGARLLAQGPSGQGRIIVSSTPELEGIARTLATHVEASERTTYFKGGDIASTDRVLLFAGREEHASLASQIHMFKQKEVPLVVVAPFSEEEIEEVLEFTDIWIEPPVQGGIIPDEKGNRVGDPTALCALFTGQVLYLYVKEMLEEFE